MDHSHIDRYSQPRIQQWQQAIDWNKVDGMLPAIVQDVLTRQVLMQGFMNPEALEQSLSSGKVTFYSRSKQRLWCKGETSGNFLLIRELALDCDCDSLLILAWPCGPTCHKGSDSCYSQVFPEGRQLGGNFSAGQSLGIGWLGALERIVQQRRLETDEQNPSYVKQLLERGLQHMAQKVGEEGVEVALAAVASKAVPEPSAHTELASEAGDLLFHLIVLLQACGSSLQDAIDVLEQRHRKRLRPS